MTLVFAHRGSGPRGPAAENTVAAFEAALSLGADGVELDVRRSRDDHLVVHHDAVLADRTPLRELDASALPSSIPSLEEALEACGTMAVNVEIKNDEADPDFDPSQQLARVTARLLVSRRAAGSGGPLVVSSFSRAALAAVREVAGGLETAWLYGPEPPPEDPTVVARRDRLSGLHPFESLVDAPLVAAAHAAGLAIRVWTVDDPARLAELGRLGVDAVITNDVSAARAAVSRADPDHDGHRPAAASGAELAKGGPGREQSGT